jgi:translin
MSPLDELMDGLHEAMAAKNAAREAALAISRRLVRTSANATRATHRGNRDECRALLADGAGMVRELHEVTDAHPDIYHAGYTQDAMKEFAEAHLTAALVNGLPIPSPEDLCIETAAFLNGAGEAIGELRRAILDAILRADVERARELLALAEDVQSALMTFDYPDALTSGLRRTTDAMRGLLERTRGDVVTAVRQARLEARLSAAEGKITPPEGAERT